VPPAPSLRKDFPTPRQRTHHRKSGQADTERSRSGVQKKKGVIKEQGLLPPGPRGMCSPGGFCQKTPQAGAGGAMAMFQQKGSVWG
jgi:hypothetical protein